MKKTLIYIVITVAALALIIWTLEGNKKENQETVDIVRQKLDAIPVLVDTVEKTPFDQRFTANGNFIADEELSFLSEVSGRVTSILVQEGDRVGKGQLLARIDDKLLRAELKAAEVQYEQLQKDQQRYRDAFRTGGVTQKQVDDIQMQLKVTAAQLESIRQQIDYTHVKAPISGVIDQKHIETGSYLAPGNPMFDIVNLSRLKLRVNVPEARVVMLEKGQQVQVRSKVFPEETYSGEITFIAAKGDASLNYPVEIVVTNPSGRVLKPGMFGTAEFDFPQESPGILISRSAFVGGIGSNEVFVVKGQKAELRKVVSGNVLGDRVEVLQGLEAGEMVVTSGQINLVEGSEVAVQGS